jgi:dolichol kinase
MQPSLELTWQPEQTRDAPARAMHRPANLARSVFHFSSAAVGLASVALLPSRGWLIAIALSFAAYCWSMEIARRISPAINDRLMRFYGPIAHAHERYRVNSGTWYATALVALALFGTKPAMMAALAVLGVADPVAAMVGRRWGRHRLRAGRSLEGSLAFLAAGSLAAAIALALGGVHHAGVVLAFAPLAGLAGALAELVSTRLDDNLTIPVTVGAVVTAASLLL